ncbi:hypothetical protein HBH53_187020 [Parastagonospora nodorum]|nr:hypothetical protein HBH53_187020 [Parastagonospora nodorum]KAH3993367.1 hypothetical protein HBI10_202400 [Parastagonospora nodorum]KAH4011713.1 hypothetical protein HBI13_195840 [Parastagonospora nodorum]KAH4893216.1 hypothetical protein HBH74_199920 [Parastagonospora nodorum]KAH4945730.1 hypothetical protein HBH73_141980 [Parastagonospora nodorum]
MAIILFLIAFLKSSIHSRCLSLALKTSTFHPRRTAQHEDESVLGMRALNMMWQPSGSSAGITSVSSYWLCARSNVGNVAVLDVRICWMRISGLVARFDIDCIIA